MASNLLRLGNNCNEKCLFCTIANDNEKELTTDKAKKAIETIALNGKAISFTGGEPTLRKDFAELVGFAKKEGIKKIELQSNAVLLDRKRVKKLKEAGLNHAFIALHSHRKDISERLTGLEGSFEKTVCGIKNLLAAEIPTTISHVITTLNYKELCEFCKFAEKEFKGINSIYFGLARPNGRCAENKELVPRLCEIEPFLEEAAEYCKSKNMFFEMEGVPLCYITGFEENNVESRRMIEEPVLYIGSIEKKEKIHQKGIERTKIKGKQCILCYLNKLCCGVWKEYAELYGCLELFPQYTDAKKIEKRIRRQIQ